MYEDLGKFVQSCTASFFATRGSWKVLVQILTCCFADANKLHISKAERFDPRHDQNKHLRHTKTQTCQSPGRTMLFPNKALP